MDFIVGAFTGAILLLLVLIHNELKLRNDRAQSDDASRKRGE